MPKPNEITDRKPQAHQQNAQKPTGPRTPPESEPRPSESGRVRDDPSMHGPTRTTIQATRKFRQENPDSDEKNLILSKTARTSLFRRFRLKRNAPDDSKQYEITKQTHGACSAGDPTNGTPRSKDLGGRKSSTLVLEINKRGHQFIEPRPLAGRNERGRSFLTLLGFGVSLRSWLGPRRLA